VILNDPFLGKQVQDGNFVTVPLSDEFMKNVRLFIFETYCRIHQCIDIWLTLTASTVGFAATPCFNSILSFLT
ncbi:hypothetical protein KI387_012602, partial [Taxus chinensis]